MTQARTIAAQAGEVRSAMSGRLLRRQETRLSQMAKSQMAKTRRPATILALESTQIVPGDHACSSGCRTVTDIMAQWRPYAVFYICDAMAMGVLDAWHGFYRQPFLRFRFFWQESISMIKFDTYPLSSTSYEKTGYAVQTMIRNPVRLQGIEKTAPSTGTSARSVISSCAS